jgi:hypothetical protein
MNLPTSLYASVVSSYVGFTIFCHQVQHIKHRGKIRQLPNNIVDV